MVAVVERQHEEDRAARRRCAVAQPVSECHRNGNASVGPEQATSRPDSRPRSRRPALRARTGLRLKGVDAIRSTLRGLRGGRLHGCMATEGRTRAESSRRHRAVLSLRQRDADGLAIVAELPCPTPSTQVGAFLYSAGCMSIDATCLTEDGDDLDRDRDVAREKTEETAVTHDQQDLFRGRAHDLRSPCRGRRSRRR